MEKEANNIPLAVITGCDTGIGKCLCGIFIKNGFHVALSYINEDPFPEENSVSSRRLDLRSERDIESFFLFISELLHQGYDLRYMVLNAGIAMGGPVENLPLNVFREVFEVNFFGQISLIKKMIPLLIKSRGRVVIMGSMAGKIAVPFLSPYASSKFALEGFTDSLRRELNPFGVRTVLIEPGGVDTPIWSRAREMNTSFVDAKYLESLKVFIKRFVGPEHTGMDAERAAEKIFMKIRKKNLPSRYIVSSNRLVSFLETLIPAGLFDVIFRKYFIMNYGDREE